MKKLLRHPLTQKLLIRLVTTYARLVFATVRVTVVSPLPPHLAAAPAVFALWHQQIAFVPVLMRQSPRPWLALMSASRDGTAMRLIAAKFGIRAAIGSSHRGAFAGTRGLLRAAQSGHNLLMTPDGPRGPARSPKPGTTEVSRLTGLPLIPCALWSNRGITFNSWDTLRLPTPFARITLVVGAPLAHPTPASLQRALNTLTAQAQEAAGCLADNAASN